MENLNAKQEDQLLEEGMEKYYEDKYPDFNYCDCGNELISDEEQDTGICRECV